MQFKSFDALKRNQYLNSKPDFTQTARIFINPGRVCSVVGGVGAWDGTTKITFSGRKNDYVVVVGEALPIAQALEGTA